MMWVDTIPREIKGLSGVAVVAQYLWKAVMQNKAALYRIKKRKKK